MPESNPYSLGDLKATGVESSGVKFTKGRLEANGKTLSGEGDKLATFAGRTGGISTGWIGYGVSGRDCDNAHEECRTRQVDTLKVAQQVLESWREAFKIADAKYVEADEQSTPNPLDDNQIRTMPVLNGNGLNGSGLDGFNGNGLNGNGLNGSGLDGFNGNGLNGNGLNGSGLDGLNPNAGIPPTSSNNPNANGPNLPNPDLRNPDLKNPDLPNPDLKNPDLRTPDLQNPNLRTPGIDQPGLPTVDPSKAGLDGLPDSTKTDLAGLDPSTLQNPQVRVPDGLNGVDPARVTNGVPGGGASSSPGTTSGMGNGAASATAAGMPKLPTGAAMGGMGGMPFMPMSPMGAGGDKEREGNGSELLRGEPEDWEDEEGVTAAVLRHEGA
ncbi:hypothetical protein [Nonomuraea indica]|uniref:Pentapeptide repeat-containing protein n=1 Tax=Nonomuraea indica TaxID=1581193 RepID=A0ABW8A347_9ACTN